MSSSWKKKNGVMFSDLWSLQFFVSHFRTFQENLTSWKMLFFIIKKYILSNFGLDLGLCIVNAMIWINTYFRNLFRFSFNKLLKCTTNLILNMLKTYKFTCNLWCGMCDAWHARIQIWFFVRFCLYKSTGHPHLIFIWWV